MIIQVKEGNFMAKIAALLALIVVLLGLLFIFNKPHETQTAVPKAVQSNFEDWHLYTSPSESFKVFFPSLPQNASSTVTDKETQKPKTYNTYVSQKPDGTAFVINVITFPEEGGNEEKFLNDLVNELVQANKDNELVDLKNGEFRKLKAVDFAINNHDVTIHGKAIKKGRHIYLISMMKKGDQPDPNEYLFFINSFEVTEK